jgi:chromosome segregation ATPase
LRTVERRENTLRTALKRQKRALKQLKKGAAKHGATMKALKADLKKVRKDRKSVSQNL